MIAKDTPNFIANHIGLFGVARVFEALQDGFTIEEIDAITGPALGRPKSATFRTMDLAGVDVLGHVARNLAEASHPQALPEPSAFKLPPFVEEMIERGWVGDKAGQGFYKTGDNRRTASRRRSSRSIPRRWSTGRSSPRGSRHSTRRSRSRTRPNGFERCTTARIASGTSSARRSVPRSSTSPASRLTSRTLPKMSTAR